MRLSWVSRRKLEAAETRVRLAEAAQRAAEDHEAIRVSSAESRVRHFEEKLAAGEAERKLLLDRIVQLSGQPALYERQPPVASGQLSVAKPDGAADAGAGEPKRVTIEELRAEFHKAAAKGQVNVERCRARA